MPRRERLSAFYRSDRVFYWLIGAFTTAVFLVGLGVLWLTSPGGLGTRELAGFVVGFGLYMAVYLASMAIYRRVSDGR